jgi:hypothetical protein
MAIDEKQQLLTLIKESSDEELGEMLEAALKMHLSNLQKQQKQIEADIAKTKKRLERLSSTPKPATKPKKRRKRRARRRSGPRVSDVIRQTLREAGGPLPLSKITQSVARATNRPLTDSLRSYVSQLIRRESSIRKLSRGLYGISA